MRDYYTIRITMKSGENIELYRRMYDDAETVTAAIRNANQERLVKLTDFEGNETHILPSEIAAIRVFVPERPRY